MKVKRTVIPTRWIMFHTIKWCGKISNLVLNNMTLLTSRHLYRLRNKKVISISKTKIFMLSSNALHKATLTKMIWCRFQINSNNKNKLKLVRSVLQRHPMRQILSVRIWWLSQLTCRKILYHSSWQIITRKSIRSGETHSVRPINYQHKLLMDSMLGSCCLCRIIKFKDCLFTTASTIRLEPCPKF